ncbi:MAG: PEP-CTERM sorting domain-containing protein [Planctomycetes bacterium]|nr:PEP-CTERM sorting domain-containing protein [Planctomycetota bacterium]
MKISILFRIGMGLFIIACAVTSPTTQANIVAIDRDTTNLYAVSSSDATLTWIGTTGIAEFGSLEYREADGFLYGVTTGVNSSLYRIDATDASITLVGALGVTTFEGGLAFAADGTAYGVNGGSTQVPVLYQINMENGEATLTAAFNDRHDFDGLGWYGDGLIGLDKVTNALLAIDPKTADISLIREVDPIVGGIGGMILNAEFGYFATAGLEAQTPGSNELYTFDPKTGSHEVVGTFTVDGQPLPGSGIAGLAVIPEPATILLFAAGGVSLMIRRRRD